MNDQMTSSSIASSMICVGQSMYPTLHVLDTLSILPYAGRSIRRGDVVIFIAPAQKKVTHRVVLMTNQGIKTRGDNALSVDDWTLRPDDILGQVISVKRGNHKIPVYGGPLGFVIGVKSHKIRWMKYRLTQLLKPFYDFASTSGIFRIWLPAGLKPRVLSFSRRGYAEMQLQMGQKAIGSYDLEQKRWMIKPPYRLFVDEASLPNDGQINFEEASR